MSTNTPLSLKERLENKTAKVAVLGLGYVGLPFATRICRSRIYSYWN